MDNYERDYNMFLEKANAVINSKYIMSGNNINILLKYIANTPSLMECISKCNQSFNFNQELDKAGDKTIFRLPSSKKKTVALVSGILYSIDRRELNFNAFLMKYFNQDDYEDSYKMFVKNIIIPYTEAFKDMLSAQSGDMEEEKIDSVVSLNESIKDQIYPFIASLQELVAQDNYLKEAKKSDYLSMLDGLQYAYEISNSKLIKIIWIGFKSVFVGFKAGQSYINAMDKLMSTYKII
ncbi:MAG: hypothetical protein RR416_05475 [Clostridia bacterium]